MTGYVPPLRDMIFALYELHDGQALCGLPGLEDCDRDTVAAVLTEAGRFCSDVLEPLNRRGDEEGCHFRDGSVVTPGGFAEAYRLYREAGWSAMGCDPRYGGMAMPRAVSALFEEMVASGNLAFGSYPGLSHAGYFALAAHGDEALCRLYLPPIVEGRWTATMCLTEAHCGSDLSLLRTRANPLADGKFRVTGTKIFISAGDHDLAENIIHLVLARLPGAPPGTRGISLFLVPKFLVGADGAIAGRNTVVCGGLEHKMGLKGSATCTLNFDGAVGWMVGAPNSGLQAMFAMMNKARLSVAQQGIGLAEISYQRALAYCRERVQGKAAGLAGHGPDPIVAHPDVRRMLLTQKTYVEGMRALSVWIGLALDERERHPGAENRRQADEFVALMTPVAKSLFTDTGFVCANLAVQCLGGHGYIRENAIEQHVRDCRIGPLYEGTNGIQALDLVVRKLRGGQGRLAERFLVPARESISSADEFSQPLGRLVNLLEHATRQMCCEYDQEQAAYCASDYLKLFGLVALAVVWARMANAVRGRAEDFYREKLACARFFFTNIAPESSALAEVIASKGASCADYGKSFYLPG